MGKGEDNLRFIILTNKKSIFNENYLKKEIEDDGVFTLSDFSFISVSEDTLTLKEMKPLRDKLIKDIIEQKPQAVITVGSDVTKLVLGNVAISKVFAKMFPLPDNNNIGVIPCYDPNAVVYDAKVRENIKLTFLALKLTYITEATYSKPEIIKLETDAQVKDAIQDLLNAERVGYDVETAGDGVAGGLSPFNKNARILTAAFSTKTKAFWVDVQYSTPLEINPIFYTIMEVVKDKLVAHNRPFDHLFTKVITGVSMNKTDDSMVAAYLCDENQALGLKALAFKHLGWMEYADTVRQITAEDHDYSKVDLNELGKYNALDAAACLNVFDIFYKKIKGLPVEGLYNFLIDVQDMYTVASMNGTMVDIGYIAEYKAKLTKERDQLLKEIYEYPEIEKARKIVYALENGFLNKEKFLSDGSVALVGTIPSKVEVDYEITKPRHLLALLSVLNLVPSERTEKGGISLAAKTLEGIDHPIIDKFKTVKKYSTILNTFIKGFKETIKYDQKVHPYFHLCGTVTGRTSCDKPNLQQIPRDKEIKNFFYAPEGHKLVQFDFAQAEVRVIASLANDENLIKAITAGADMHKEVAAFMFNKSVEDITPDERQAAKTLNFGVIYGMSAIALSKNLGISEEDAAEKLSLYMNRFSGVKQWIMDTHDYVRRNGTVTTPLSRTRHLPGVFLPDRYAVSSALRQAQNSPIQATASDLNLWLLLYVFKKINKDKASFLISVHDSGVYMVHESYIEEFKEVLRDGINELNKRFTFLKVPMKIDVSIAEPDESGKSRWGKVEDVCSY